MAQIFPCELLQKIFNNESHNIKFLHSCLLVNKSWSSNAIPILWNRPFHLMMHRRKKYSHLIIFTYYSCSINQTFYNYHSFLRHLSFFSFLASVQEFCTLKLNENVSFDLKKAKEILLLFVNSAPMLESLEFTYEFESLFKLINVNFFNKIIMLLIIDSSVRKWILDVKKIDVEGGHKSYNIEGLYRYDFSVILQSCRNIKTLKIRISDYAFTSICQLIKSQINLESFTLYDSEFQLKLGVALVNQKSSLRTIEFSNTYISPKDSFDWILQCSKLESVIFTNTLALPLLSSNNQAKLNELKCLIIKGNFYISSNLVISLIQSSNNKLQQIELKCNWQCEHQLILEMILYHCTILTKLGVTVNTNEFPALFLLLKNCSKLNFLEIYGNDELLDVDDILPELGLSLPFNLHGLIIRANWKFTHNSLLSFFKNSEHNPFYEVFFRFCDLINEGHHEEVATVIEEVDGWRIGEIIEEKGTKRLTYLLRQSSVEQVEVEKEIYEEQQISQKSKRLPPISQPPRIAARSSSYEYFSFGNKILEMNTSPLIRSRCSIIQDYIKETKVTKPQDFGPCKECDCNDYSLNVFKKGSCKNCFHQHIDDV